MSTNAILALVLAVTSMTGALAQPPGKIYRLGMLAVSQPAATWRNPVNTVLIEGLEQLGYVDALFAALASLRAVAS